MRKFLILFRKNVNGKVECQDVNVHLLPKSLFRLFSLKKNAGSHSIPQEPAHYIYQSNASEVFHTFQTLPTRSGPGFNVFLPGFQPEGVASVPLLFRTSWNA